MRVFVTIGAAVLLAGCVQLQPPVEGSEQAWQAFGQQWALKGYVIEPKSKLTQKVPELTPALFAAYEAGYQAGKNEYCQQDPFVMGLNGKIYYGICNDVDRRFLDEYWRGKRARSKR